MLSAPSRARSCLHRCVAVWYELHLPGGTTIDLGPPPAPSAAAPLPSSREQAEAAGCPLPYMMRARAQRLHFLGYERRVCAGERIRVEIECTEGGMEARAPLEDAHAASLRAASDLVRGPGCR